MVENVSILAAFAAGVLSFISPCVLPLIPGYLSFISGVTLDDMQGTSASGAAVAVAAPPATRRRVILTSLCFILGFSIVFVTLGATASALGQFVMERLRILGKIAGVVIIIFGLHTMGVLRIGWLYSEKRVQVARKPAGPIGAILVGIAFAFGWTPCIGPILAGILAIAAAQETIGQGVQLLAVYSRGTGHPLSDHGARHQLVLYRLCEDPAVLPRHRARLGGPARRDRRCLIFTDRFTTIARVLQPYLPTF